MFINVSICCWMCMVYCRINLDEFWVKIAKSAPQTRRNSLLAQFSLIAKLPRRNSLLAQFSLIAQFSEPAQKKLANSEILCFGLILACWSILGSVVHSIAFLSSFYNFVTPKQHLGNAHNIK
jgi:hypothetical protein